VQTWDAGATWMANQGALLRSAPDLADAVAASHPGRTVLRDVEGRWVLRRHRHLQALVLTPEAIESALGAPESEPPVVVVQGVGGGGLLEAALARWPDAQVHGWDRDPDVLRVALERCELSAALLSGRLQLHAGAGLLDLPKGDTVHRVAHPDLAPDVDVDVDGEGPWVVVLDGALFVQDLCDVLPEHGYRVFRLRSDAGAPPWFAWNLRRLRAVGVFSINHTSGVAELCTALGVPLVEWEIDPALDDMMPATASTARAHLFTWRARNVSSWRDKGIENVVYMPLAANVRRRKPDPEVDVERYGAPVVFVGNSMAERMPHLRAALQGLIEVWARQRGAGNNAGEAAARLIPELIQRCRKGLPAHVAPEVLAQVCPGLDDVARARGVRWKPALLLGEMIGGFWRHEVVASLAPMGVQVWGDPGWRGLERHGVRYRGFAGHTRDLGGIYCAAGINVDIGRIYQADIVTMRVFDVLACGGFLIAAWSEGLGELFALGEELETWKTLPELVEKTRYYLDHPDARDRLAARGRQRVLQEHSVRQRIHDMLVHTGLPSAPPSPLPEP
jgi:hypothetical protein